MTNLWLLGPPGPEMDRIEALLVSAGEAVDYAVSTDCETRVTPDEAYAAHTPLDAAWGAVTHLVGCAPAPCPSCDGSGYALGEYARCHGKSAPCQDCGGRGTLAALRDSAVRYDS